MFDLDQKLSEWRKQMLESNVYSASNMEELRAHVLDVMDDLKTKGLNEEEAFCVAVHRIGDVESLNREFSKVNRPLIWRRRIAWLLAGYFIISAIGAVIKIAPRLVFTLGAAMGAGTSVLTITSIILAGCLTSAILILLFSKRMWNSSLADRITSIAKDHYIIFLTSILILGAINRIMFTIITARTLNHRILLRMSLVENLIGLAWPLLLIPSLCILAMLIKRSRSLVAKH
jgi:hypothetical protein